MNERVNFCYGKRQDGWGIFDVVPSHLADEVIRVFQPTATNISQRLASVSDCDRLFVLGKCQDAYVCFEFQRTSDSYGRAYWVADCNVSNSLAEVTAVPTGAGLTKAARLTGQSLSQVQSVQQAIEGAISSGRFAVLGIHHQFSEHLARSIDRGLPGSEVFILTGPSTSPEKANLLNRKPEAETTKSVAPSSTIPGKARAAKAVRQSEQPAINEEPIMPQTPERTTASAPSPKPVSVVHSYLGPLLGAAIALGGYIAIHELGMLSNHRDLSQGNPNNAAPTIQAVLPESFAKHQQELALLAANSQKAAENAVTAANNAQTAASNVATALTSLDLKSLSENARDAAVSAATAAKDAHVSANNLLKVLDKLDVNELASANRELRTTLEKTPRYEFEVVNLSNYSAQVSLNLSGKKHYVTLIPLTGSIGVFRINNQNSSVLFFEGSGKQNVTVVRQSGNDNASFLLQIRSIGFSSNDE